MNHTICHKYISFSLSLSLYLCMWISGEAFQIAIECLLFILKSLPSNLKFNIISYSTKHSQLKNQKLFTKSSTCRDETRIRGLLYIHSLKASPLPSLSPVPLGFGVGELQEAGGGLTNNPNGPNSSRGGRGFGFGAGFGPGARRNHGFGVPMPAANVGFEAALKQVS